MDAARRYINQLGPGEVLDQVFLVRDKDLRTTTSGSLYICCTLVDRTGKLPARMWQASESIFTAMPTDGFVHVKGRTENYRGALQFIIDGLRPYRAEKVDLSEFLPASEHDVEQMWGELVEHLRAVRNQPLRLLIKKFLEDRSIVERFKRAPAAMQLHHAFIGGLLEHTVCVMRLAKAVAPLYPRLNADLLLAGVFLHDIGKTEELNHDLSFSYTDRGQLVGHITAAAIWIQQKADLVAAETGEEFPQRVVDLLQHLVLSHHGTHEFGSPKLPMTPEAIVLHHLDNLDAKTHLFCREIDNDPDPNASFTSFQRALDVRIYKRSADLDTDGRQPLLPLGPGLLTMGDNALVSREKP